MSNSDLQILVQDIDDHNSSNKSNGRKLEMEYYCRRATPSDHEDHHQDDNSDHDRDDVVVLLRHQRDDDHLTKQDQNKKELEEIKEYCENNTSSTATTYSAILLLPNYDDDDEKEELPKTTPSCSLGEFKDDDDDDGFRTPTSMDHKIPPMKECPPAPRKPKTTLAAKRKLQSSPSASTPTEACRRSCVRLLDISQQQLHSTFSPPSSAPLLNSDSEHCKIKRARREEADHRQYQ